MCKLFKKMLYNIKISYQTNQQPFTDIEILYILKKEKKYSEKDWIRYMNFINLNIPEIEILKILNIHGTDIGNT